MIFTILEYIYINLYNTYLYLLPTTTPLSLIRYHAHIIAYSSSFFVFGGRDKHDLPLNDLYRYDLQTMHWTQLTPVKFNVVLDAASSIGSSLILTSWGLLRYGGYYRQPYMPEDYGNYVSDLYIEDPVTLRWSKMEASQWPLSDGSMPLLPLNRYLSGATFVPSNSLTWRKSFSYRGLYDEIPSSTQANYAGALADSVLIFGGSDGTTGSTLDGSTGGMLGDMWMLRLSNWSTAAVRARQTSYLTSHCAWRSSAPVSPCLTTTALGSCEFREMLMLAWCNTNNATTLTPP